MRYRKTVITIILLLFALSIVGFGKFFPDSIRFELMADLRLSEGALYQATNAEVKKLENWLNGWNKKQVGIDNFVAYIGIGSPRYYQPLDIQIARRGFAQFVLLSKDLQTPQALRADLLRLFEHDFPSLRASVLRLENGSPVGFPVQFRVNGNDISKIRAIAHQIADAMRSNANINQYAIELERAKYYHAH